MYRIIVKGVVQGVGFRPYIYRKAIGFGLKGSVKNLGSGVEIICDDKDFVSRLTDLPPLSKIHSVDIKNLKNKKYSDFTILKSSVSEGETELPADIFMCNDCLRDLRDPKNRRYGYYFVTCTNCGPRFSMIEDYPYDRPYTAMRDFEMCTDCKKEYTDPMDRRYHAQTIACPRCGPKLRLLDGKVEISGKTDQDTVTSAIRLIRQGKALAIKGVGGFHICSSIESVNKVRKLLKRPDKPFAIMVKDIEMLEKFATVNDKEKHLLKSPARPIVVVKKNDGMDGISELDTVGAMMPYTALHYLMFDHYEKPLLMTSCNIPGEPVMTEKGIARFCLTHDREIVNRCDDSVLKVIEGKTFYLRRSRGFAPLSIELPKEKDDTIALGAELNNVVCSIKSNRGYLSQYIGETSKLKTQRFMDESVKRLILLTRSKPKTIVCDKHPGYYSTAYAKTLAKEYDARLVKVQHHKAHVASVAAEHKLKSYVGIAIDGLGYGDDGKIWGGEVFDVENKEFKRIGHLEEQPQIGGDSATLNPKKMLFGILAKFLSKEKLRNMYKEADIFLKMIEEDFNVPKTTSAGRVLDAAAALLGICDKRTYDGRPAMLLESKATQPYDLKPVIKKIDGKKVLMTTPLFEFMIGKDDVGRLAATAQMYLAKGLFEIAKGGKPIVLSGGVAYNRMISGYLIKNNVLVNVDIPAGDGGLCVGQAYLD